MTDHVTEIVTKADMAAFARAHESGPVGWHTEAGPGGTIIVHEEIDDDDRS